MEQFESVKMKEMQTPCFIHLPRPGTHYSPSKGSAIATVIYEIAQAAHKQGVSTRVILKRGVADDYRVGQSCFVDFGSFPRRWQRRIDNCLARWKRPRFFLSRFLKPALDAIEVEFAGPVFFHDSLEFLHDVKVARPHALICGWLHNYKWRHLEIWELRRALSAAHRIICVSDFVAQALISECSAHCDDLASKVAVVLNGVDTQRFKPAARRASKSLKPVVITFAGRIIEKKGVHLLLDAAQILATNAATQNFTIRFIGSKSIRAGEKLSAYESQLHQRAQILGEKVEWVGTVGREAMPAELANSDIVCVPSLWEEPFGLAVLEGMACGATVVASRRGGIPEAAGDAALYFDPADGEALASILAKLIANSDLRNEMQQKSRQRALQLSWDHSFASLRQQVL